MRVDGVFPYCRKPPALKSSTRVIDICITSSDGQRVVVVGCPPVTGEPASSLPRFETQSLQLFYWDQLAACCMNMASTKVWLSFLVIFQGPADLRNTQDMGGGLGKVKGRHSHIDRPGDWEIVSFLGYYNKFRYLSGLWLLGSWPSFASLNSFSCGCILAKPSS